MSRPLVLWHAWSNNCRDRGEGLYIGHAWIEGLPHSNHTLCGVEIQEIGEQMASKEEIGCRRCKRSRHLK